MSFFTDCTTQTHASCARTSNIVHPHSQAKRYFFKWIHSLLAKITWIFLISRQLCRGRVVSYCCYGQGYSDSDILQIYQTILHPAQWRQDSCHRISAGWIFREWLMRWRMISWCSVGGRRSGSHHTDGENLGNSGGFSPGTWLRYKRRRPLWSETKRRKTGERDREQMKVKAHVADICLPLVMRICIQGRPIRDKQPRQTIATWLMRRARLLREALSTRLVFNGREEESKECLGLEFVPKWKVLL